MKNYPELRQAAGGMRVNTVQEWEKYRRPEILSLFQTFVYGTQPFRTQLPVTYSELGEERVNGTYRRRTILAKTENLEFPFYLCLPEEATHRNRVPVILYNHFKRDFQNEIPVEYILERGYAVCSFPVQGVAADGQKAFQTGVFQITGRDGAYTWGAISAWAWGASRIMDFLETANEIREDCVAVGGHSRGGKTALWEMATDQRFGLCLSMNSGCAGASLSRNISENKETVGSISKHIGYWFADAFKNYADAEQWLPVDQHMLLALAAPRPIYVTSATQDAWADPEGELQSCLLAGSSYELYGKKGLVLEGELQNDVSYASGSIAYHRRTGTHGFTLFDWEKFLDFADRLWKQE